MRPMSKTVRWGVLVAETLRKLEERQRQFGQILGQKERQRDKFWARKTVWPNFGHRPSPGDFGMVHLKNTAQPRRFLEFRETSGESWKRVCVRHDSHRESFASFVGWKRELKESFGSPKSSPGEFVSGRSVFPEDFRFRTIFVFAFSVFWVASNVIYEMVKWTHFVMFTIWWWTRGWPELALLSRGLKMASQLSTYRKIGASPYSLQMNNYAMNSVRLCYGCCTAVCFS